MQSRVCVTVQCPSVCLSVPSFGRRTPLWRLCSCRSGGQEISIDSSGCRAPSSSSAAARGCSMAVSSKCGQCHVVSWRRKLNTDLFTFYFSGTGMTALSGHMRFSFQCFSYSFALHARLIDARPLTSFLFVPSLFCNSDLAWPYAHYRCFYAVPCVVASVPCDNFILKMFQVMRVVSMWHILSLHNAKHLSAACACL